MELVILWWFLVIVIIALFALPLFKEESFQSRSFCLFCAIVLAMLSLVWGIVAVETPVSATGPVVVFIQSTELYAAIVLVVIAIVMLFKSVMATRL